MSALPPCPSPVSLYSVKWGILSMLHGYQQQLLKSQTELFDCQCSEEGSLKWKMGAYFVTREAVIWQCLVYYLGRGYDTTVFSLLFGYMQPHDNVQRIIWVEATIRRCSVYYLGTGYDTTVFSVLFGYMLRYDRCSVYYLAIGYDMTVFSVLFGLWR